MDQHTDKKVIYDPDFFAKIEELNNEFGLIQPAIDHDDQKWVVFSRISSDDFFIPFIAVTPSNDKCLI